MATLPKRALNIETLWLRGYARTYLPCEAAFAYPPAILRRDGVTLVDVCNAFRNGIVVRAEKLDEPGAIWIVEGEDCDGRLLSLTIKVVSETQAVTLRDVKRVDVQEDEKNVVA